MVRACRYIETTFLVTTKGSPRSISLNGFQRVDLLVMNAKNDPTLGAEKARNSIQQFVCVCHSRLYVRWLTVIS